MHEIVCDLTHIGSADDSDILLALTEPLHARILHNTTDEYELTMLGEGTTSSGPEEILRTGAHFSAGPWQLVFVRDEFADHGRPYGGRRGGELAHQAGQPPRPSYADEHPASSLSRCALRHPDDASDLEQTRALGRVVLSDEREDTAEAPAVDFQLVNDETAGVYEATVGDVRAGGVTYNRVGNDRIILLGVALFPEFRGRGISTELVRGVLDDVRAQGKRITNYCPVVSTFIDRNPGYADLIDPEHRGRATPRTRSQ